MLWIATIALIILFSWFYIILISKKPKFSRKSEYGKKSHTLNGEEVKSQAERIIADYFKANNIKYEYEREVRTNKILGSKKISNPDFYLLDYDVYVEYWGLVDADDKKVQKEYVRIMKWKMAQYHANKIKFISIYPRNLNNLDWIFRKKFEDATRSSLPFFHENTTQYTGENVHQEVYSHT